MFKTEKDFLDCTQKALAIKKNLIFSRLKLIQLYITSENLKSLHLQLNSKDTGVCILLGPSISYNNLDST